VFHVNLVPIRSAVPEIFHTQQKVIDTRQCQKQNLTQFTACCNKAALSLHMNHIPCTLQLAVPSSPSKLPFPGGSGPDLIYGSLARLSRQRKQHLDRFSHSCRAHDRERATDHTTPSVIIGHILQQCGLKMKTDLHRRSGPSLSL